MASMFDVLTIEKNMISVLDTVTSLMPTLFRSG